MKTLLKMLVSILKAFIMLVKSFEKNHFYLLKVTIVTDICFN